MTLRLDSLLPANPELKLLIKMDIEGSEVSVLDHLRAPLPEQTFVFIELHRGDESIRWIRGWSTQNHFHFHEVRRRDDAIDGYLVRDSISLSLQRGKGRERDGIIRAEGS